MVRGFTRLSRGEELDHEYISKIWRKIKVDRKTRNAGNKMLKAAEAETFGIEFLESLTGQYLQEKHWYEVLEVSDQERVYITSVLESGEVLDDDNPRIVLSTIHKANGRCYDNVALVLESVMKIEPRLVALIKIHKDENNEPDSIELIDIEGLKKTWHFGVLD